MAQGTAEDQHRLPLSWDIVQEQHNSKGRSLPMTTPPLSSDTIEKLNSAVYPSFAMVAGMQLDVFTPLQDGPMSVEHLAEALAVQPHKLRPLLYALVAAGLLTVEDERFANTSEAAHFLVRGQPTYLGDTYEGRLMRWRATLHTAETIRTGVPQAKIDYAAMPPDQLAAFYRGIHAEAVAAARTLMTRHDCSSARYLVDIGGGSGGLALTVAAACPQLQATVIDLATVTPITQRYIEEAGLAERVHVISADAVQGPLRGAFDVAVLFRLLQVLSPDQACRVLRNVGQIVEPGGTIYIIGQVLDNSRLSPPETVAGNLFFLNVFDEGQAYTEQEHWDWLADAGFAQCERLLLPNKMSIVSARKPK
jgi:ubiquinone/menaquinone biosynthesis C-methylase UbiE